ncbi:hypothetical protein CPC08DRAFT_712778 [Agrocybe pediades]|nr:hypothetical protein CPC08DRAFT_712778 [Agrocybe pediades]
MTSNLSTIISRRHYLLPGRQAEGTVWFNELAQSHLSRHVQSWVIKGQDRFLYADKNHSDDGTLERAAAVTALLLNLPRYPNLRALRLKKISLSAQSLSLIGFITNLKSLHFEGTAGAFPFNLSVPLLLEEFGMDMSLEFSYPAEKEWEFREDDDFLGWNNLGDGHHTEGEDPGGEVIDSNPQQAEADDADNLDAQTGSDGEAGSDDSWEDPPPDRSWTISSLESLQNLSVVHRAGYNGYTNRVSRVLQQHTPHTNLVSLVFTVSAKLGRDCLVRLLEASPLLETLKVIVSEAKIGDTLEMEESLEHIVLDRSACPLLRAVTCCPQLAKVIVPGRPVIAFSMQTTNDFWNKYKFNDVISALQTLALEGIALTTLCFERTLAKDAEEILPLVASLFPELKALKMIVKDSIEAVGDGEFNHGVGNAFRDDTAMEDPNDIRRAQDQFNHSFEGASKDYPPPSSDTTYHDGTYLGVLSKVAAGRIQLPDDLQNLELVQSRAHKRYRYSRDHELIFLKALAYPKFAKLELVKFGADNVHNISWKRNLVGLRKKPGWFFDRDGKYFVGAMHILLGETGGTFEAVVQEENEVRL